jgi:hypothetical protein
MSYLKLIEQNNVSDLSALVFNRKLTPKSKGTFTDVLNETEEKAVVKQLIDTNYQKEWRVFILEYFKHYTPFNSSVDILLDNAEQASVHEILKSIISKSGLRTYQAEQLCRLVSKEQSSICFHLLEAYCRNPHSLHIDSGVHLALLTIDEKRASHGGNQASLAELYKKSVEHTTATVV